jgi:ribonuclease-3
MQPLESRIQYKFRNSLLLAEALTHPSLAYESQRPHFDNQRLEFLGDAVLQLAVTGRFSNFFLTPLRGI